MSDDERLNLRDLPPVPAIAGWPDRYSQTMLRHADSCMRSAYLYVKYRGGTPSHQLDRGSLAHSVFERMTLDLLAAGESSYIAPSFTQDRFGEAVPEDPSLAARQIASLTAAVVDEVAEERRDLAVPTAEKDAVRVMAYHWALGMQIDPEKVVAVERKFVLELAGHQVSGKVDLAALAGDVGQVDDYKTAWNVPDQEQYEKGFQARLYALLLLFGRPVEKAPCSACSAKGYTVSAGPGGQYARLSCQVCGGDGKAYAGGAEGAAGFGRGYVERFEDPIGERVQWVRTREIYPRYLRSDGQLQHREAILSRTDIADFRNDVEQLIRRLDGHRDAWKFPAVNGSHCSECPCEPECPLPAHLRRWAGVINDHEQAAEAAAWADTMGARVAATNEEIKRWANANGPVRYGEDLVREFVPQESRSVRRQGGKADWDGLSEAVVSAAEFGEPFELDHWVLRRSSMSFKKRKLTVKEREAEGAGPVVVREPRDFGDAPPF